MGASRTLLFFCGMLVGVIARETNELLPPPGSLPDPADPWANWDVEIPAIPLDPVREPFDLPPAESLFPPRAAVVPLMNFEVIRFEGNTVFSDQELTRDASALLEAAMSPEDLDTICEEITLRYVAAGYVNSGAVIAADPDDPTTACIRVTEGKLDEVVLRGNRHLRDRFLTARLLGDRGDPLHFPTLQKRLQTLQLHPGIERIQAELRPGLLPGESYLDLTIEDRRTLSYGIDFHNQLPPSVGAEQVDLWVRSSNLTGHGDSLYFRYGIFAGGVDRTDLAGIDNLAVSYQLPINRFDTTLAFQYSNQGYVVIEEPFADLLISGQSQTWSAGLRHPLFRNPSGSLWASLALGQTDAETELLGVPFSIAPGFVTGELNLTTLEAGLEWNLRGERSALFLGSRVILGLDALGARASSEANPSFFIWRNQFQYLRKINSQGHTLAIRGGAQWADGALPSPQQVAVGGLASVRGFRENELVRDMGASVGFEYRMPVWESDRWTIGISPFLDAGIAQDHDGRNRQSLISAGIGLNLGYGDWFRGDIYWGHPLKSRTSTNGNLQDQGIHFRLTVGNF